MKTSSPRVIVAIDYSCIKYLLYFRGEKFWQENIHGFKPAVLIHWAKQRDAIFQQIKTAVSEHAGVEISSLELIGLVDKPFENGGGYWRSRVYEAQQQKLKDEGLAALSFKIKGQEIPDEAYKGNRLSKESYTGFMKVCNKLMYELPHKVFKADGAEADDLFGYLSLCVGRAGQSPGVLLYGVTLDQDWSLCCQNKSTFFVNLHRKNFLVVLDSQSALEKFQQTYKKIKHFHEVPLAKSLKGERSDNLAKGFDPRLADLVDYSLSYCDEFLEEIPGVIVPWDFTAIHEELQSFAWGSPVI
jgi:hypothetical protein